MIFTERYQPVIEDFTQEGTLSLFAILKIFENVGNHHSDKVGDSVFMKGGRSTAWILMEWQVVIEALPHYHDSITVATWSEKLRTPFSVSRDFILYKDDVACVRGTTKWVLANVQTELLCAISDELVYKYEPEDKTVFSRATLAKIKIPAAFSYEHTIAIRRSDFDFNDHIHNLTYLTYALEAIPEQLYKVQQIKKVRITYKAAIKSDTAVLAKYAAVENTHVVCICSLNGQVKALVQFE
ncbi:MAG: acyl-[acyl-carrier-protein] thioesterase [Treponema sp.]